MVVPVAYVDASIAGSESQDKAGLPRPPFYTAKVLDEGEGAISYLRDNMFKPHILLIAMSIGLM